MSSQEIIKLIAAGIASICVLAGLFALFKGLKAEGEIDLGGLVQGKVKTGSAGVIMLFFGTIIFCTLIVKGSSTSLYDTEKGTRIDMKNTIEGGYSLDDIPDEE